MALSSPYLKLLETVTPHLIDGNPLLSLTKGLRSEDPIFISDYLSQTLGNKTPIAVLSGPNLALEIAKKQPSATVIASKDVSVATHFQNLLSNGYFRVYRSSDMRGVELGGVLKNIMAIAAGIVDGLQLGHNAKAALMARGLQEMIRFGTAFGAESHTFSGLSGLGDLIATCESPLSRNRTVGEALSKTQDIPAYLSSLTVTAEGINTAKNVWKIAQDQQIDMPITEALFGVLVHGHSPRKSIESLMNRTLKSEQ
ncbi:MAG: NAD(P)-dependent glycerol-3-phosphate dehydrogenase [Candidatus Margulisbacteria bacterium]|nr:NAD(P)-dependent glycerol-3-phosphate dehydrogenase [Candidatus Margulisiibacteriota bacterium]